MSRTRNTRLRSVAALAGAGLTAVMFTAVATPAHAASTVGGPISRSEVISRAQSWVNEGVPYNESGYETDSNGTYREDCSGYVSMAWHLSTVGNNDGLTTETLPSVSTVISNADLQPGDALDYTAEHTFLFNGYTDQSTGSFTYYAESNPSDPTHGPSSASFDDSTVEGWPTGDYEALRYNNITDDAASSSNNMGSGGRVATGVHADGRAEVFEVTPTGGIQNRFETTPDGSWSGWTDFGPSGSTVTAVAAGRHADGRLEVYAVLSNGSIENKFETTADGSWSGWNDFAPAGTAKSVTVGVHADGRLEVYAVTPTGAVQNKYETVADGAWSGWNGFGPSGSTVTSIAAGQHADGRLEVYAVLSNGSIENKFETTADGSWSGWNDFAPAGTANSDGVPGVLTVGVHSDGRVEVFAVTPSGAVQNKYETVADGAWSGWSDFGPSGTAINSVASVRHTDGRLEVYAVLNNGSIENKFETIADGSWSGWTDFAPSGSALG
jgi:acylphosphatase